MFATGAVFAAEEVSEGAKNDPALAMRLAASPMSDALLEKVGQPIKDTFDSAIVPVVRGGILALNVLKASQTWKDPAAHSYEKYLDVGRVAFDLVGFAGSVAAVAFPKYAGLGNALTATSYAVDVVSHSIRSFNHLGKRQVVWHTKLAAVKELQEKQKTEATNQEEQNPSPPLSEPQKNVEFSLKGPSSAVAAILRGENQAEMSMSAKFAAPR